MAGYVVSDAAGRAVYWHDSKRYLWLLSVFFPLQPFIGVSLHAATGNEAWLFLSLPLNYVLNPVLDWLFGKDPSNPPAEVVNALDQDRYYRWLTWLIVPLHVIALIGVAAYASAAELSLVGYTGLALWAGMTAGLAINSAHELGHKNSRLERWLGRIALAVPGYGHFSIDHNRGHHRDVATPDDPASARMGESFYRFAAREIPGVIRRAWAIEADRLSRRGKSAWSIDNHILQNHALSLLLIGGLVAAFGLVMLPFMLVHNVVAWLQLTSANYIEHYGLLRQRDARGRLEPCRPEHSWNCNRTLSNLVLFHLERHSDHHANPLRRYQSLRHYDDVPQLPTGYFGCYVLAYIPPLWFRVMDQRLLSLPHVNGDLDKLNIEPSARHRIEARYGKIPAATTA